MAGGPVWVSEGTAANARLRQKVDQVQRGEFIGKVEELVFRDPDRFVAGSLHGYGAAWEEIMAETPRSQRVEILSLINEKVSIFPYFQHYKGKFQGQSYDSDRPPQRLFRNNTSCKDFGAFIRQTLLNRLKMGAVSLLGKVGCVEHPHIVLPLTVEPSKPRLCHDARYLNLWMVDKPFSLDRLIDLPRYVSKGTYQTVLDDKSGYDDLLLSEESRPFFGLQWGGWYSVYNTLTFGWKISPYVYHTTGLAAANIFRSSGIPCLLYIDDRHTGQLQVQHDKGEYRLLKTAQQKIFAAAESAIFLVMTIAISPKFYPQS